MKCIIENTKNEIKNILVKLEEIRNKNLSPHYKNISDILLRLINIYIKSTDIKYIYKNDKEPTRGGYYETEILKNEEFDFCTKLINSFNIEVDAVYKKMNAANLNEFESIERYRNWIIAFERLNECVKTIEKELTHTKNIIM
jgi:hypothetical protein